ncbi:hypothetical protein AVEN_43760-1 [Araneus ventricosus]|uniref:Uncharacterized protein n=1 Tax=Araneus ventricosus TaxID=182803 RepID=A0A4Y2PKY3_ARAVE|nr:hypothetical protein AVEN_43760-1 [Araneus ventricosus]
MNMSAAMLAIIMPTLRIYCFAVAIMPLRALFAVYATLFLMPARAAITGRHAAHYHYHFIVYHLHHITTLPLPPSLFINVMPVLFTNCFSFHHCHTTPYAADERCHYAAYY